MNCLVRYVPRHLHQMLMELLKNSLRAVHERVSSLPDGRPPTPVAITSSPYSPPSLASGKRPLVRVIVADGIEDVTIKVKSSRVAEFEFFGSLCTCVVCCRCVLYCQVSGKDCSLVCCSGRLSVIPVCITVLDVWAVDVPRWMCQVSDEGGGFKRSGLPRMWSYLYRWVSLTRLCNPDNPRCFRSLPSSQAADLIRTCTCT